MRRKLSGQEFHALYCPVKNTKSALFLVAFFSLQIFLGWKGLHKAPERPDLVTLPFLIIVMAMLAKWLVNFTCFRERLVFVLVIVSIVTEEVYGFFPAIVGPYPHLVKSGDLALSLLGFLVSLTMLVQSARSPNVGPSNGETPSPWQPRQKLAILLVLILTVLALGCDVIFRTISIAAALQPQRPAYNRLLSKESESPFKQPRRVSGTKRFGLGLGGSVGGDNIIGVSGSYSPPSLTKRERCQSMKSLIVAGR